MNMTTTIIRLIEYSCKVGEIKTLFYFYVFINQEITQYGLFLKTRIQACVYIATRIISY